ncbi:MAG: hypothetical protein ACK46D_06385, partial [Roseiflexaceae bacterium]
MRNTRIRLVAQSSTSFLDFSTDEETTIVPLADNSASAYELFNATAAVASGYREIRFLTYPDVVIGKQFTGALDGLHIYRRTLSDADISILYAQGWKSSTTTAIRDGSRWSTTLPANIEAQVDVFSTTQDQAGNTRRIADEYSLWGGEIDTYAPRVIQQMQPISNTNRYRYTIQVDDNNMDAAAIQTPCGASLVSTFSAPQSILNDSTNMLFDGTLRKQTHMEGACELGSTPLITKLPDFPLSHTDVAVAGQRLQYIGGQNELI